MKKHYGKTFIVGEVAKHLGISFETLAKEFAECNIDIFANDSVNAQTLEYVISGLYEEELDWGAMLHLETGDVAGEIEWSHMRAKDGSEYGVHHDLTVAGWSQKLGMDEGVLLNELHIHGHAHTADDVLSYEHLSEVISGAEVHQSRHDSIDSEVATYHCGCMPNDGGEMKVSEMAAHLGVPATALTAWLHYNGKNDIAGSAEIESWVAENKTTEGSLDWTAKDSDACLYGAGSCNNKIQETGDGGYDIKYKKEEVKLENPKAAAGIALAGAAAVATSKFVGPVQEYEIGEKGYASVSSCTTGDCDSKLSYTCKHEDCDCGVCKDVYVEDEVTGVVASGEPVLAGATTETSRNGVAWGLLGFLLLPLLAALFLNGKGFFKGNSDTNIVDKAPMVIHGTADDSDTDTDTVEIPNDDGRREDQAVDSINEIVKEPATGSSKVDAEVVNNVDTGDADSADNNNDILDSETTEPVQDHNAPVPEARDFINELVKDIDAGLGGPDHQSAPGLELPANLPETGTN